MIAPDRSVESMKRAKEAARGGEFVDLPSPYATVTKPTEERREWGHVQTRFAGNSK